MRRLLIAIAVLLSAGSALAAKPELDTLCQGDQTPPKTAPRFEDYAAPIQSMARPAEPKLDSKHARLYRTLIRQAARGGEVFAGHYRVARLGCGSGCTDLAIIDSRTGRVWFDEEVRNVVDHAYNPFDRLTFRPDSRLLMVSGAPHEDDRRNGVAFYEWTGQRLAILKRYRYDQVCRRKK